MSWVGSSSRAAGRLMRPRLPTPASTCPTSCLPTLRDRPGREARRWLSFAQSALLPRHKPGQGFGHGAQKRRLLLFCDQVAGDEAEGRRERRPFRLVANITVLRFPGHERLAGLGKAEERAPHQVPRGTAISL